MSTQPPPSGQMQREESAESDDHNKRGTDQRRRSRWLVGSTVAFVLALALLIVVISLPPYGDYTTNAKVAESILAASSLKTGISEFYREQRRLPDEAEAVRFSASSPSRWVERIAYEPSERRLVVTLREILPGKRFALLAREQGTDLYWSCRTIDLDPRYLPPACRN